jgi:hypothetical protein
MHNKLKFKPVKNAEGYFRSFEFTPQDKDGFNFNQELWIRLLKKELADKLLEYPYTEFYKFGKKVKITILAEYDYK